MTSSLLEILVDTLNKKEKSTFCTLNNIQEKLFILSLDLFLILDIKGNF